MSDREKLNILLVDDQPSKLMTYEVILRDLDENLIKASSAREAFEQLLKNEVAVVLVDVCMPELDGFELAAMIREHPRFRETAMIFISAVQMGDVDRVRGYAMGAVDYVPVPVVPEVLRAKVKIFTELFRKTRQLETLNRELESRVKARTQELEDSTQRLAESERRFREMINALPAAVYTTDADGSLTHFNPAAVELSGRVPQLGTDHWCVTWKLYRPDGTPMPHDECPMAISIKEGRAVRSAEAIAERPDGTRIWFEPYPTPLRDADGKVVGGINMLVDITERKRAEEMLVLLAREVDHRARNALAVVQAIVRLTSADDMKAYVAAVEGRIAALARAHGLLSESRWQGADLAKLVNDELAPYRSTTHRALSVNGPPVLLASAQAQTIALVLHELATNAAKYGALSHEGGALDVTWRKAEGRLFLTWSETGLSDVRPPSSRGFGTKVIQASIQEQLRGVFGLDWRPEGLHFTMEVPDLSAKPPSDAVVERAEMPGVGSSAGSRILIVEDETLVALMIVDILEDAGHLVMGPFATTDDALLALKVEKPDGAVLDVNLVGSTVYPLANALEAAGVPFVFSTGYDSASIDQRFKHIPVVQKPLSREKLMAILPLRTAGRYQTVETPMPQAVGRREQTRRAVPSA